MAPRDPVDRLPSVWGVQELIRPATAQRGLVRPDTHRPRKEKLLNSYSLPLLTPEASDRPPLRTSSLRIQNFSLSSIPSKAELSVPPKARRVEHGLRRQRVLTPSLPQPVHFLDLKVYTQVTNLRVSGPVINLLPRPRILM